MVNNDTKSTKSKSRQLNMRNLEDIISQKSTTPSVNHIPARSILSSHKSELLQRIKGNTDILETLASINIDDQAFRKKREHSQPGELKSTTSEYINIKDIINGNMQLAQDDAFKNMFDNYINGDAQMMENDYDSNLVKS